MREERSVRACDGFLETQKLREFWVSVRGCGGGVRGDRSHRRRHGDRPYRWLLFRDALAFALAKFGGHGQLKRCGEGWQRRRHWRPVQCVDERRNRDGRPRGGELQ
ncbi:MAG TPA: hypothetical protein PKA37_02915, partial [Planctomycetota bacterium]|nr:hypothetical protein [Planctomycetota bacterium]